MGSRKIYLVVILVGAVIAVAGILMKITHDPALRTLGTYLGWGGIALVLIARLFFSRRSVAPPRPPSNNRN